MGRLLYAAITSLDGYVNDSSGDFEWSAPDEEVHAAVNDLERRVGTQLYGRRMYEVLKVWEDPESLGERSVVTDDFAAIWRAADKVVYSTTMTPHDVTTARTTLERRFDPAAVRAVKSSSASDLSIGGPGLAAAAVRAGLVDEIHLFLNPIVVGGGTRALPDDVRLDLTLVAERRFAGGVVPLHYEVGTT
jgi:dihydrofolate reductase